MNGITKYDKAIIAAVSGVLATVWAVTTGAEPAEIVDAQNEIASSSQYLLAALQGFVTTVLVYLVPNKD